MKLKQARKTLKKDKNDCKRKRHGSHTCRRFVRFPIAADKVPDRDWLGAPLYRHTHTHTHTHTTKQWSVKSAMKFWEKRKQCREKNTERRRTNRPITRESEEQVIMAQLQASTEYSSQLLNTPCGSLKPPFMLIKASTAILTTSTKQNLKKDTTRPC